MKFFFSCCLFMLKIAAAASLLLLAGCGDGVPNVADVNNIVVEGKPMSHQEFLDKYCLTMELKMKNKTCAKVIQAQPQDKIHYRRKEPLKW